MKNEEVETNADHDDEQDEAEVEGDIQNNFDEQIKLFWLTFTHLCLTVSLILSLKTKT